MRWDAIVRPGLGGELGRCAGVRASYESLLAPLGLSPDRCRHPNTIREGYSANSDLIRESLLSTADITLNTPDAYCAAISEPRFSIISSGRGFTINMTAEYHKKLADMMGVQRGRLSQFGHTSFGYYWIALCVDVLPRLDNLMINAIEVYSPTNGREAARLSLVEYDIEAEILTNWCLYGNTRSFSLYNYHATADRIPQKTINKYYKSRLSFIQSALFVKTIGSMQWDLDREHWDPRLVAALARQDHVVNWRTACEPAPILV